MSKPKRRKRSKKRKREKLRKRIRKILQRRNRELQHSDLLSKFQTYIDEEYHRGNITLYRWAHSPYTDDDFRPQIFQSFSDRDISEIYVPSPTDKRNKVAQYVRWFTLSHYLTEEQAISNYKNIVSKLRTSDHPERVSGFKESKGMYVTKCYYTENDALYGNADENGHIDILLCNGFDPKRVVDTTYTPVKIV